jgi:hypothetical protein
MSEEQPGSLAALSGDAALDPELGQIWIARPDRGPEVRVLIIEVHDQYVQALLCGDDCDRATETDAVLSPSLTGLTRRLLVHGDISASILKRRLWRSVGQIEPHLVERIARRGRGFDFASSDLGRGAAILTETDPRWKWKLEQHRHLRAVRARASELGLGIYGLGPREG